MPDEYLDSLSSADRAASWTTALARRRDRGPVLVAEHEGGGVVGFASVGTSPDPRGAGELFALNVDPDQWGRGAGRALLEASCHQLVDLGFDRAVLWVLPDNQRARRLYEAAGWNADGAARIADVLGVTVPEVRYRRTLQRHGSSRML